jgi:inosine/xanthosine triphosphate pyrophosphatase family protein
LTNPSHDFAGMAGGRQVLVATRNPGKLAISRLLISAVGAVGLSLEEAGIPFLRVDENGSTPEENARIKAEAYFRAAGIPVFASDSGMEIDGLGGLPGVKARRWNGLLPDDIGDEEWLEFFLRETRHIPPERRTGRFVTAWAVVREGRSFVRRVVRPFRFAEKPVRTMTPGFPMSAVIIDHDSEDVMETVYLPAFTRWIREERVLG